MHPTWNASKLTMRSHPDYTGAVFETAKLQKLVDLLSEGIVRIAAATPFDAIAGSGNSGVPIASVLSYKLGIPLITVRKPNEDAATAQPAQGLIYGSRYLIIDDLISSGRTIRRIINEIEAQHNRWRERFEERLVPENIEFYTDKMIEEAREKLKAPYPQCVGIILYHDFSRTKYYDRNRDDRNPLHFGGEQIPIYCVDHQNDLKVDSL